MTHIGKPKRKPNPFTGRYAPTKRTLAFKNVVAQRRADVAKAAKAQRKADSEKLNAAVTRAEHAVGRAQARERAAQRPSEPKTGAAEGTAPGEPQNGAQTDTAPPH